jgi:acyl-CoA oxidase
MLKQKETSGLQHEDAWNSISVQLVEAAEAHCRAFLVERYVEAVRISMNDISLELRAVMQQLCELYCVYWVLQRTGDFLMVSMKHTN